MRALAMTGMVTAFWISWIFFTGDMRATPPSLRMSEGTRSSAITDAAPASSAILACSALVTSMMTPPLSISASPMCLRSAILSPLASAMKAPLDAALHRGRAHALDRMRGTPSRRAHHLAEPPHALVDLAARHGRKRQPQRPLAAVVHPERRARSVGHAALERPRQQRPRVEPGRPRHQQREAALGLGPRDVLGHSPLERGHERVATPAILGGDAGHVAIEQPSLAEAVDRRLDERARVQVRELLGGAEALGQRRRRHEPAEAQPGEQHTRDRKSHVWTPVTSAYRMSSSACRQEMDQSRRASCNR